MKNRKYDVTALGELLIDFTENGDSAQGNPLMEANPGGAPCNAAEAWQKNSLYWQSRKRYVRKSVKKGCRGSWN